MSQKEKKNTEDKSVESVTVVNGKARRPLPGEVYEIVEKMDEDQILAEMKGELVKSYVYSFEVKDRGETRKVTGLTYAGVRQAIRGRGHVEILPCHCCGKAAHVDEDERLYKAQVRMRDIVHDVEVIGASVCSKNLPFAYTICVNKAERNAIRKIIPEKVVVQVIEEYLRRTAKPSGPTKEELIFATIPAKEDEDLRFVELEDSWEIYPIHYLLGEESWHKTHKTLAEKFKARWVSAKADSHWSIPKYGTTVGT